MGIPDHPTYLMRNLYTDKEATVRTGYRTTAAAAAAKSLQSCPAICDPTDGSPPGSSFHGILQARILEWIDISFSNRTTDWFQNGKGVRQGCILLPSLFNLYAEYIMRNAGLDEAQAGIKIARRNISNLRRADDTTLMAESERTKEPPDESERGEWKRWFKTQHSKN